MGIRWPVLCAVLTAVSPLIVGPAAGQPPPESVQAYLLDDAFAGIHASPLTVAVRLHAKARVDRALSVKAPWVLRRLPDGKTLGQGCVRLRAPSRGEAVARLPFPKRAGYGLFEYIVRTAAVGGPATDLECRVTVMRDPPADREMDSLGLNIHVANNDTARLLRRMGVRWARVDWNWGDREPSRGNIAWDFLGGMVDVAERHGLKLFPVLTYVPPWARQPDGAFLPEDHASYVGRVLSRYRGKITAFNVWNEPEGDSPTSATKNPALWVADLKAVRQAALTADPNCKIVGIALSGNTGDPGSWNLPLLEPPHSIGQYLDAYDWHSYPAPRNRRPEGTERASSVDSLKEWTPRVRALVAGREVWITEHGYTTCDPRDPRVVELVRSWPAGAPFDVTEKQQGDYLVRQVLLELAHGIDRVFLYQLGPDGPGGSTEDQFGITRARPGGRSTPDLSCKVAYLQLAAMVQEIAGTQAVRVELPAPAVRVARFRRGDTDVVAVWTVEGAADLRFRMRSGYLSDPYGNRTTQRGSFAVRATESPIFLVGSDIVLTD